MSCSVSIVEGAEVGVAVVVVKLEERSGMKEERKGK